MKLRSISLYSIVGVFLQLFLCKKLIQCSFCAFPSQRTMLLRISVHACHKWKAAGFQAAVSNETTLNIHHSHWEDIWSAICPRTCRGNPWCFEECLGNNHHQGSEQNTCWLCREVYGSKENTSFLNFPERYSDEHSHKIGCPLDFLNCMDHK